MSITKRNGNAPGYTLPLKGRELISVQVEIGSHLGFNSCELNPMTLRLGDARQPCWSYSDSNFGPVTASGCRKSVYLQKAEYRVSQHEVNFISKYVY